VVYRHARVANQCCTEAATNVAVAAKSLGVKAFVNLSQMTVSEMSETETTSSPQQKQHWLAEQVLRWSGLPVVYLRPTAFFDGMLLVQGAKAITIPDQHTTTLMGAMASACA
jgi:uncharacterized protein YbjT (DUF2867 family)